MCALQACSLWGVSFADSEWKCEFKFTFRAFGCARLRWDDRNGLFRWGFGSWLDVTKWLGYFGVGDIGVGDVDFGAYLGEG